MQKLPHFFTKMAITSTRKVQIPKFWCLKSSTSIWPSFGNINSIQKVKNMELEQKKGSKLAKIGQIFALQKIKFAFSQKFSKVWFHSFFLWLPMYQTNNNSLTKFIIQDRCGGRDVRVAWQQDYFSGHAGVNYLLYTLPVLLIINNVWKG